MCFKLDLLIDNYSTVYRMNREVRPAVKIVLLPQRF